MLRLFPVERFGVMLRVTPPDPFDAINQPCHLSQVNVQQSDSLIIHVLVELGLKLVSTVAQIVWMQT